MSTLTPKARGVLLAAIVVVTAFVVATLFGLGGTDEAATTTTTTIPPTTTTTAPPTTTTTPPIVIPDEDYGPVCVELQTQAFTYIANPSLEGFRTLLQDLDYEALLAVSTEWLRPSIETLRDSSDEVVAQLAPIEDPAQFDPASLPEPFVEALSNLIAVAQQKCNQRPA